MDTLYTFWDNITHSKNKSVHFLGLMNSATKLLRCLLGSGFRVLRYIKSTGFGVFEFLQGFFWV